MHEHVEHLAPQADALLADATSPASPEKPSNSLASIVGKIAAMLGSDRFPSADRAALRRYGQGQPIPLAFYRLWLQLQDELPKGNAALSAWAVLVCAMARGGPKSHQYGKPFGSALFESGYSEARLERLLSADADVQLTLFDSTSRFLAAKGASFDWTDAAALLFSKEEGRQERARRKIAESYYTAQRRASK